MSRSVADSPFDLATLTLGERERPAFQTHHSGPYSTDGTDALHFNVTFVVAIRRY